MTVTMQRSRPDVGGASVTRRRRCRLGLWGSLPLGSAMVSVWARPASASPLDDAAPSSEGMPGGDLVRQIVGWGMWLGLGACGLVILYGASTWAGFGSASAGRAQNGKSYVIAGLIGAAVIGLTPTLVGMMFDAGAS